MRIEDFTRHVDTNVAHGRDKPITRIVVHRFGDGPDWWDEQGVQPDILGIERFFQEKKPGGLSELPYAFAILEDGTVQQGLPLNKWNWHARGWSDDSVSIAVLGNFTKYAPSEEQIESLIDLCEALQVWAALNGRYAPINGHTELKDGSKNPRHVCPGPFMDLQHVRHAVEERMKTRKERHCSRWGLVAR